MKRPGAAMVAEFRRRRPLCFQKSAENQQCECGRLFFAGSQAGFRESGCSPSGRGQTGR